MKFNRTDLVDQVDAEIERCRAATAADNDAKAGEYAQARGRYVAETGDAWAQFAATIRRRVRAGAPVTRDDIPEQLADGHGGYLRVWRTAAPKPRRAPVDELLTLRAVLLACTDDEVTATALERLGVRIATLFTKGTA